MIRIIGTLMLGMFFLITFTGCKKMIAPSCNTTEKYTAVLAKGMGTVLTCKNTDAIALDLNMEVEKLKLCEKEVAAGIISTVICGPISSYVTTLVVNNALPKKWDCSGTATRALIYSGCILLPF